MQYGSRIIIGALLLLGAGCAAPSPETAANRISEGDVAGDWNVVREESPGADFDTIILEEDGRYSTFVAERPFTWGTWTLQEGKLQLKSEQDTENLSNNYSNMRRSAEPFASSETDGAIRTLRLYDEDDQKEEMWQGGSQTIFP